MEKKVKIFSVICSVIPYIIGLVLMALVMLCAGFVAGSTEIPLGILIIIRLCIILLYLYPILSAVLLALVIKCKELPLIYKLIGFHPYIWLLPMYLSVSPFEMMKAI